MNEFHIFRDKVKELVKAWNEVIKPGIEESGQYGETNTRKYLIDPILEALNWVDDGSKKIIDNEFAVKHKTGTGSADYALKVNGIPKILLEAKDVAKVKDLENGYDLIHGIKRAYPRQLSNYCHDLNHSGFDIKFAILTNGKEWIIYNMQYADISSEREVIFRLDLEELDKPTELQKLWALEYNDFASGYARLREIIQQLHDYRLDIDKMAVQQLLECKDLLSSSILNDYERDKRGIKSQIDNVLSDKEKDNGMPTFQEIPEEERLNFFIKEASSNVINKVLFIRILEDKNFLAPVLTKRSVEKWKDLFGYSDYDEIMELFRKACGNTEKKYNGGLFRLNPYDKVEYDPDVIKKIIDILGDINFREIDSDIIGRIYEIYLGQVLKVEAEIRGKKRTKYKADNKERKKLGQYYTPKFVVDFIVKNTLGKLIEGKNPEDVGKIRILDPACGSGSFLIKAYDTLVEYYEDWNKEILKKIDEINKKKGAKLSRYQNNGSVPNYKNIILKENIHGIDLNGLSVQIAEINLWLRALERDKKLIKLNKNILHGNSLVTGVETDEELSAYKEELEEIKQRTNEIKDYYEKDELDYGEKNKLKALEAKLKVLKEKINIKLNENLKDYFGEHFNKVYAFNWEVEFPQIMQEGGFDVVIGNPPYFNLQTIKDAVELKTKDYLANQYSNIHTGQNDILYYFYYKSIQLLKEGGLFGFITSRYFLESEFAAKLRSTLLNNVELQTIIDFGSKFRVFEDASVNACIVLFKKAKSPNKNNKIKIIKVKSTNLDINNLFKLIIDKIPQNKFSDESIDIFEVAQKNLSKLPWTLTSEKKQDLLTKLESGSVTLGDTDHQKGILHVVKSIESGMDDIKIKKGKIEKRYPVYRIDDETIRDKKLESGCILPLIKNGNVRRYYFENLNDSLLYITNDTNPKDCPNVISHLKEYKKQLEERYDIKKAKGRIPWFRLSNLRNIKLLEKNKDWIVVPLIAPENRFMFVNRKNIKKKLICTADVYVLIPKDDIKVDLFYILGILNSKLMNYYHKTKAKAVDGIASTTTGKKGRRYSYQATQLSRIPIRLIDKNDNLYKNIIVKVSSILNLNYHYREIISQFVKAPSNQPISDPKSCKLAHYFDNYELYEVQRETSGRINEIKAKIVSLNVKEEGNKLVIYMTNYNEEQKQLWKNIKALTLTIKDEDVRKFLFFSIKNYINEKRGRGFGTGNLLELIKKIEVPVYVANVKMNIGKIKAVMKEFNRDTKNLWFKDESNKDKFNSLTDMEEEIIKTDRGIDEMVYDLYGITEEEKKIIEESLK